MLVLGIDPGLTRCGIGLVRRLSPTKLVMEGCGVIRTEIDAPIEARLLHLDTELRKWIGEYEPDAIAVERVFSQLNVRTAMSTGQAAGVALVLAASMKLPVALHTPSEVKAAVTGSGRADKKQVATMVTKILGLSEAPKPVDTTDALALAICHHWRGKSGDRVKSALEKERNRVALLKKAKRR